MKALKIFLLLTISTLQITSYAQSTEFYGAAPISDPERFAKRLEILSYAIDIYYEQMIDLKTALALSGLKTTSHRFDMFPEDAKKLDDLENTRKEISDAFINYKADIDTLSTDPENIEIYENLKFLYNIVLVKAFLPRFDAIKNGFLIRIFTFNKLQFVQEIIPRGTALELFYKDFSIDDRSKSVLNSDFRLSSLIKIHNEITAKLNLNRESNLYQKYPKHVFAQSSAEEAYIYDVIIKGETLKPAPERVILFSCSALFAN